MTVLVFVVGMNFVGGTNANFFDQEKSENNIFSASTLDFSVSALSDFSPKVSPSMETTRTISIAKEGFLDFDYRVSASSFSGNDAFCSALEIKDNLDGTYQPLKNYLSYSLANNKTKTSWVFTIKLNSANSDLAVKTCDFDLKFEAWQESLAYGVGGFSDVETISNKIESEHWTNIANHLVVNEVYYDVGAGKGSDTNNENEWVEIYNPTSSAVKLKNWQICDNTGCDTISTDDVLEIPANGYAVITNSVTTWDFWNIPGNAVKIALESKIGGHGLNDDGDHIYIKNPSGTVIDAMSYEGDNYAFNSTGLVAAEGHSLARKPAGQDTNTKDDFEELVSPNPGTNPHTVVMNEILPNPIGDDDEKMPGGEWIEVYNFGEYDIELKDWKIENDRGDKLEITEENTSSGSTVIAGGEFLVIYRNGEADFHLDDDGDEVRLLDEQGLIKDSHKFESTPAGKTIARFPDAIGPWIDPDPTPGDENEMNEEILSEQILLAGEKCFDEKGTMEKKLAEPVCQVEYLRFLGLIVDLDDEEINFELWEKVNKKDDETKQDEEIVEEVLVSDEQGTFEEEKETGDENSDLENNKNQNEAKKETGDEEKEEKPVLGEEESDEVDDEKKEESKENPVKKDDEEENKSEVKEEEKKEEEEKDEEKIISKKEEASRNEEDEDEEDDKEEDENKE